MLQVTKGIHKAVVNIDPQGVIILLVGMLLVARAIHEAMENKDRHDKMAIMRDMILATMQDSGMINLEDIRTNMIHTVMDTMPAGTRVDVDRIMTISMIEMIIRDILLHSVMTIRNQIMAVLMIGLPSRLEFNLGHMTGLVDLANQKRRKFCKLG